MKLIFSLIFIISSVSCNLKVTETAKTYVKPSESSKCLKSFYKNVINYFDANISPQDFKNFWICFSNSIEMFAYSVNGKDKDQFTVEEIADYISKLLTNPPALTKELKKEVILFKKWLVGGSDMITKSELQQISQELKKMTPSLLELLKHMEFYNIFTQDMSVKNILSKYSWSEIEVRLDQAKTTLVNVLKQFSKNTPKTFYSYSNFQELTLHTGLFFNNGAQTKFSKFIQKQNKLFSSMQTLLLSKNTNEQFSPKQWKSMLNFFSDTYSLFIQYRLTMHEQSLFNVKKLDYFILWYNNVFKSVSSLIEVQPNNVITYDKIVPIFEVFHDRSILPFRADEEFLSIYIGKYFTTLKNKSSNTGLNIKILKEIKKTVNKWARAQVILSGSVNKKVYDKLGKQKSAQDIRYYDRLLSIAKNSVYVFKSPGVANIYKATNADKTKIYNLFVHNNLLSLVEKIFYTYSFSYANTVIKNKSLSDISNIKLKSSEVKSLTKDAFVLLRSLGIYIPASIDNISSLVQVLSQFFSYSSKGYLVETKAIDCMYYCPDVYSGNPAVTNIEQIISEDVSFKEVFELFSIAHSAIKKAKQEIIILNKECSTNCVDFFFKKIEKKSGLFIVDNYFNNSSADSKKEFFSLIYKNIFNSNQELTESKLFLTYTLLYFIESVMLRYDKDNSGILDKNELKQAILIFKGLVIKLLQADGSDTDQYSINQAFHFVLTMPLDASAFDKINFLFNPPVLQADPLSLTRVLSKIISPK
ncbi:MAG: hypothetical protein HAW60_02170 [Bdellovibrionales bacterium]|nr:hypothetical protein [Bdellovibrionales bacterium]